MRYEVVSDAPKQLAETSAIIKNMGNIAISLRVVNTKTATLILYPNQELKYVNSDVYATAMQKNARVRIQIIPYKVTSDDNTGTQLYGFLPLSGGTIDGNLNVNGRFSIYDKEISTLISQMVSETTTTAIAFKMATDSEVDEMLDDVFG